LCFLFSLEVRVKAVGNPGWLINTFRLTLQSTRIGLSTPENLTIPPQKICFGFWGNWGPKSPKQKKNASGWQAKIKAAKILNHEPAYAVGGTQSPAKTGSAGDLKENKKPFFEAARKKRFVIFWCLCCIPEYLLPDKLT
jgi:hypothetical protein